MTATIDDNSTFDVIGDVETNLEEWMAPIAEHLVRKREHIKLGEALNLYMLIHYIRHKHMTAGRTAVLKDPKKFADMFFQATEKLENTAENKLLNMFCINTRQGVTIDLLHFRLSKLLGALNVTNDNDLGVTVK